MRTIAIASILAAVACGHKAAPTATISFATVTAKTGPVAGPSWDSATALAVSDFNSALDGAGASFRFNRVQEDSTSTPATAVQRATDAVRTQGAKAIVIDTSADDIALHTLYYDADPTNDLNVPIVCMVCTSPAINNPNAMNPSDPVSQATLQNAQHWNWRTVMSTTLQAEVVLKIALKKGVNGDLDGDGKFQLAIYASDEPFGHGFATALTNAANSLHPTPAPLIRQIFHPVMIDPNTYDWAGDVTKLTQATTDGVPDFVLDVTLSQFDAALIKSYVDTGQTIPMLHTHATRLPQVLITLGATLEGQEGTSHVIIDGSSGATFSSELSNATAVLPGLFDANAYDAAATIMLATMVATRGLPDATKVTGAQIRDALGHINDPAGTRVGVGPSEFKKALALIAAGTPINYDGASGPCDFDANGNVLDRLTHWKVANAAFVDQETYDCVSDPSCPVKP